ncbi:ap2 domain transcription factor ap2xii-8 [Cystoisospora suis]|uniref:Ap2 domain transcription factor ap2xii-8 n=1 Tax=Cystoisospora suis TaxID=483139 RepID=A0A2C6L1T1_9APIC|nr:ap2 domain transcription factor ap2xii-8 [Cystoisospora suis]
MDAENGTAKLHQGAGVASQPSPCPSPLPVSSSAAASPTPTISSSMPASATTAATSSESVEAEAGHIYQPGTKARYGVQGAWEQAEAARQYINAHGTLPPHFVVQSLPSKANGSSSSNQKGRRGPASAAASTATAGYTSSSSSGASSGAGVGAAVNSHSSGQGDGAGRQRGAGGGASGGGRSVGRGGSSSKGGGDGTEKKGRLNASQADVGSGFLNCGTGARGGGAQSAIPSPAGTIPSSCPTAAGVKTAPSVSSALPSVSVTPSVGPPGGTAAPAPSSAAAPVSTIVTQHTPGDPNSNKAAPQAVTAVGRESEMLQAGLTEGGCIRLFLPFSALSRTVVMPPGGTTAATIIVPETKILVQPGTVGTVVIATNPSGAAAGGVCGMSVGGESGGSPTCTSSTTAGGGSNVDDECHASSEASSSTSTSPVSSRGVGTVVVGGDRGSTTEQTSGLHTGATASEATGEGGQPTPGGSRPTSSAAASSSGTGGEAAEDAAAGLAEVTFLSSPVPSPPGSPPSMCRSGFAEASPGSGAGRVRPFKRRCLDVSPLFLCSGSPPTGGTGDTSSSSASSTHAEHGNSLCPRTSSLDTRNGAASTGSSLTFLLSSPPSSEYSRGPFAGFASPLPSGSKSGASAAVTFPALPPPLASFRSPDIAVQQLSRRSQEASRSESRESSCGNEKTSKKAGAGVKGERSETPVGDKKEKEDGQVSCKGQETGSGATSALASLSSPVSEMFSSPSLPASGKPQERGAVRLKNQYDIGGSLSASSSSVSASPSLAPSSISPFFAFSPFSVLPRPSPPCGPSSFPGVGGPASPKSGSACNNRRLVLLPGERSSFSASPLDDQSTPQLFTNSNPPVFSEALSTSPGLFALSSPSVASSGLLEPPHASPSRGPSPVGQSNECASGASLVPQPGDTALNSVSDSCLKPGLDLHDTTDSGSGDALGDEDGKPEGAPVSGPSPLLLSAGVGQLPPDDGCATAQLGPSVIGGGHEQDTPPQAAVTSSVQPEPGGGGGSSPSASSEKPSGFLGLDGSSRVQSVLASLVAEGGLLGASISGKIGDKTSSTGGEPQQQKQEDRLFAGKTTSGSPAVQTVATAAARASA